MPDVMPFKVPATLFFTGEPVDPANPRGPRASSPYGTGTASGWAVFGFPTLADAEAFASRTSIFGRRYGNRIGGPGAAASPYNALTSPQGPA